MGPSKPRLLPGPCHIYEAPATLPPRKFTTWFWLLRICLPETCRPVMETGLGEDTGLGLGAGILVLVTVSSCGVVRVVPLPEPVVVKVAVYEYCGGEKT